MARFVRPLSAIAVPVLILLLAGCQASKNSTSTQSSDGSNSDVAIALAAGATGSDDSSAGIALQTRTPLDWLADRLAFERTVYAAGVASCTITSPPTGSGTGTQTYMPPDCTITYANGATASLTWTGGPWNLAFSTSPSCTPVNPGLVGSGCALNSTVTWSTATAMTRTWTGPLGHTFAVTIDAGSGAANGYGPSRPAAGTFITCTTACPAANSTTGTRTVNIGNTTGASWITGTLDGVLHWNHTVYTTTPLTIVGSGQYRVIQSGTIVVEHNIAQFTTTTTFNGPLTHMAGCPFPVSGSVTTVLSSGGTETVTFTSTCGVAALVNPDGSRRTLYLSIVL